MAALWQAEAQACLPSWKVTISITVPQGVLPYSQPSPGTRLALTMAPCGSPKAVSTSGPLQGLSPSGSPSTAISAPKASSKNKVAASRSGTVSET